MAWGLSSGSKRICVCPSQGPNEKKNRGLGDTDIQKPIVSKFCRHSYFISRRPGRHLFSLIIFIMGRWETPGFLQVFPIKVGGSPHSFLKTSVWRGTPQHPPAFWRPIPEIRKSAAEPTSLAVKAGGARTRQGHSDGSRGPERGRAGQGRVKDDLAMEERKKR